MDLVDLQSWTDNDGKEHSMANQQEANHDWQERRKWSIGSEAESCLGFDCFGRVVREHEESERIDSSEGADP